MLHRTSEHCRERTSRISFYQACEARLYALDVETVLTQHVLNAPFRKKGQPTG